MLLRRPPTRTTRTDLTARTLAVAALLALAVAACGPGGPRAGAPTFSPPAATLSCVASMGPSAADAAGASTTSAAAPLAPPDAAARASATYRDEAETSAESVPLVTVETTPAGPRIETHDVDSAVEAAAVAVDAARGADLLTVEAEGVVTATASPNDTRRGEQWMLSKTTFGSMWPIHVAAGVTIAVIDTGVDATHPDLAGQVLTGCRFLDGASTGALGANDDHGHGTHVAGIAAAATNNGQGIVGGAPGARVLPVKVLDASGSGSTSNIANGIVWAANHNADVINLSLGGPSNSGAIAAAVTYARTRGVTVVAAAGNAALTGNPTTYPGATPGVIGVGAVDSLLQRAAFSNTGSYIDIAAPGVGILSTVRGGTYAAWSGTSMASPHAAAAAAIVQAVRPACTPDGIEARLEFGATDLGPQGRDDLTGHGLVDPLQALSVNGC